MRSNQDPALLRAFAAEVKAQRLRLEISQEALALHAGLNRSFMGKVEVAETGLSLTSIYRLARGLRIGPHLLIQAVSRRYLKEKMELDGVGLADLSTTRRKEIAELLGDNYSDFYFSADEPEPSESGNDMRFYQAYLKLQPGAKQKVREIFEVLNRPL